jgi:hypothetical protein
MLGNSGAFCSSHAASCACSCGGTPAAASAPSCACSCGGPDGSGTALLAALEAAGGGDECLPSFSGSGCTACFAPGAPLPLLAAAPCDRPPCTASCAWPAFDAGLAWPTCLPGSSCILRLGLLAAELLQELLLNSQLAASRLFLAPGDRGPVCCCCCCCCVAAGSCAERGVSALCCCCCGLPGPCAAAAAGCGCCCVLTCTGACAWLCGDGADGAAALL